LLDPAQVPSAAGTTLAAIGLGDAAPVYAELANPGLTRRPPAPVHPRATFDASGLALSWTRRARGAWDWRDEVDAPLVEQAEAYRVGLGPVDRPLVVWETAQPGLTIPEASLDPLAAANPGAMLWVRQIGSFAQSDPLLLTTLP
jgi:hypothetical protein